MPYGTRSFSGYAAGKFAAICQLYRMAHWFGTTRHVEGEEPTLRPQSAPLKPGVHSHEPVTHMPCPEHMLRSSHLSIGRTVSDRHILQQFAGAIGTNCPILVILRRGDASSSHHATVTKPL